MAQNFSNYFGIVANRKNPGAFWVLIQKLHFLQCMKRNLQVYIQLTRKKNNIRNSFCTDFWLASVLLSKDIFFLMLASCCFITLDKFLVPKSNPKCVVNCFIQQGALRISPWYSMWFCLPSLAYLYFYTFPTLITFFCLPPTLDYWRDLPSVSWNFPSHKKFSWRGLYFGRARAYRSSIYKSSVQKKKKAVAILCKCTTIVNSNQSRKKVFLKQLLYNLSPELQYHMLSIIAIQETRNYMHFKNRKEES